jgi:hypothetical protein
VTTAGARFTSTVDAPRGSGPRGIEWADVDTKSRALIGESGLTTPKQARLLELVHDFSSVSALIPLLHR